MGQIKKKWLVTKEDYQKWSTLKIDNISNNAKWVSYSISYESRKDTLFIKNINNQRIFSFPNAKNGTFLENNLFACLLPENRFQLYDLMSNKSKYFDNIKEFKIGLESIILKEVNLNGTTTIKICDYRGNLQKRIENVRYYSLSPKKDKLACSVSGNSNLLLILDLHIKNRQTTIFSSQTVQYETIKWSASGESLLFAGKSSDNPYSGFHALLYYNIDSKKIFQYDSNSDKNWPGDMFIEGRYLNSLAITKNLQSVIFTRTRKRIPFSHNKNEIQIWNTADKDLFPSRNQSDFDTEDRQIILWTPVSGKIVRIGDKNNPSAIFNGSQTFALLYNINDNKPSFKNTPELNYSILDIKTGNKTLFLKNQPGISNAKTLSFSPEGKFILYFKKKYWWMYCFENKQTVNITEKISFPFTNTASRYSDTSFPFGIAGWSKNDQTVFFYDEFDLWEFNTQDFSTTRLTFGREENKIYRLANFKSEDYSVFDSKAHILIPGQNIVLNVKSIDNSKSGFSFLDRNNNLKVIVYESKFVSNIKRCGDANHFIYLQEDFNSPPQLVIKKENKNAAIVFESNPHHQNYAWGHSELINYQNSKSIPLKGILYFPANYDSNKTYPMIVNIYERQTNNLHKYTNPTLLNGCSLNISNYTNNSYFVFLPDIVYELGNPGYSALDCVTSSVQKVLSTFPVNPKKVGLIGHSFGGYETDFIITQSNLFAAAIAGAAPTDFNSSYLTYNQLDYIPETWRFEDFQMRMGSTLFENYNGYQANSPVRFASNVSTPLLAYTGDGDTAVEYTQSKKFYLALRRLQKNHILLIYPKEDHVFLKPENQIDLTLKTEEWFGHYLKDNPQPKWMEPQK